ncbi:MAG: UTRA domain-containing protein, partial [Ardenticatenaceae bacterium]
FKFCLFREQLASDCAILTLKEELTDLFKVYEEKYKRQITRADEIVRVSTASPEEAELLQIKKGTPVLIRERISYDQEGEPFEVLHSVDCADRLEYRYVIVSERLNVPEISERISKGGQK